MASAKIYSRVSTAGLAGDSAFRSHHRDIRFLWRSHVQSCARRGLSNRLTIDEYAAIAARRCYYCDAPPSTRPVPSGTSELSLNGVDRVDNAQPYSFTNCVASCKLCNAMKSGLSRDAFLTHVARIASFQEVLS